MAESVEQTRSLEFSLVASGAFHRVLGRCRLLGQDQLPTWRTAFLLALLAWGAPAAMAVGQTLLRPAYSGWDYFADLTVYTRYVVAILAMVITERLADGRISLLVNQFLGTRLLGEVGRGEFLELAERANRRAGSGAIEGLLLAIAILWSWISFYFVTSISPAGWEAWIVDNEVRTSWAGTLAECLSNPIFLFLMLRWLWRFLVWIILLAGIARLDLRIVASHPDRAGGLSFLAIFPEIFSGLVFALGSVIAASLLKSMSLLAISGPFLWLIMGAWIALVALIFFGPLFLFSAPLYRAREQAELDYGALAHELNLAFHEAWVATGPDPESLLASQDASTVCDLNDVVRSALEMHLVPLSISSALPILLAAATPFLVVVATQIPLPELLQWLVGVIF